MIAQRATTARKPQCCPHHAQRKISIIFSISIYYKHSMHIKAKLFSHRNVKVNFMASGPPTCINLSVVGPKPKLS